MNMHATTTKPSFDPGKRYRTRGNGIAIITEFSYGALRGFSGKAPGAWNRGDGSYRGSMDGAEHHLDLMPDAISEYVDPPQEFGIHTQLANLRRDMAAQASVIAGMAAKIEELTHGQELIDRFCEHVTPKIEAIADLPPRNMLMRIETSEECGRNTHERIEDHTKQIGTLLDRIAELERQMPAALGFTPTKRDATPVETAIECLHDRINALEKHTGLDARVSLPEQFFNPDIKRPEAAKPTIKGGWVNVYLRSSAWHPTREDADGSKSPKRIACIQIPDITEGEGL